MKHFFTKAQPVFALGLEKEINITYGAYSAIEYNSGDTCTLNIAASSIYRIFINGSFFNCGPVRCGHGTYRVDNYDLSKTLSEGKNHIAIEVSGYNVNSFCTLDVPSFLQCEIIHNGEISAATGEGYKGFKTFVLTDRVKKIQRFSFQRSMGESYRLKNGYCAWRTGDFSFEAEAVQQNTAAKNLTSRDLPVHCFDSVYPETLSYRGSIERCPLPENRWTDRAMDVSEVFKGYQENELEMHLTDEWQTMKNAGFTKLSEPYCGKTHISENEYEIVSFAAEKTGFLCFDINCIKDGTFYITVDETIINDDVSPLSMGCLNIVRFDVKKGKYHMQTVEPFGFMHFKAVCVSGEFEISDFHIVAYECPVPVVNTYNGDKTLEKIWNAAVSTFKQNTADIPMDCPTRERAGWLCDSFFTSRTEKILTGQNLVEKVFLENFYFPKEFKHIPKGMLPMCYPADFTDHNFIPNWAMWFVLQLEDRLKRGNNDDLPDKLKKRVMELCDYFTQFENENGLLENLAGWIFVEWSKANELVWGVNFPSNMLYSAMLKSAGKLYGDQSLIDKGEKIIKTVVERSFDGTFFHDRELREDGKLILCPERTETCQYYAFFLGAATPESHKELWHKLTAEFGPKRTEKGLYPEIFPSNAFMGNYMRLDILANNGYKKQCLDEMSGYFEYMADKTGTLWENMTDFASCNHGFASYAAYLIKKCTEN